MSCLLAGRSPPGTRLGRFLNGVPSSALLRPLPHSPWLGGSSSAEELLLTGGGWSDPPSDLAPGTNPAAGPGVSRHSCSSAREETHLVGSDSGRRQQRSPPLTTAPLCPESGALFSFGERIPPRGYALGYEGAPQFLDQTTVCCSRDREQADLSRREAGHTSLRREEISESRTGYDDRHERSACSKTRSIAERIDLLEAMSANATNEI